MGFFDYRIFNVKKQKTVSNEDFLMTRKAVDFFKTFKTGIPETETDNLLLQRTCKAYFPYEEIHLEHFAKYCDILVLIFSKRNEEVFRNGFEINLKEGQQENQQEKLEVEKFMRTANEKGESMKDVLERLNRDLDIFNRCYVLVSRDYYLTEKKMLMRGKVTNIVRLNPTLIIKNCDKSGRMGYNDNGRRVFFSVKNRNQLLEEKTVDDNGIPTLRADFAVAGHGGTTYYNRSEIYAKYINEGISYLYSLAQKLDTLIGVDWYTKKEFDKNEGMGVRKILLIASSQWEKVMDWWKKLKEFAKANPQQIRPLPVENRDGKKLAEFVNMNDEKLVSQQIEITKTIRNQVGALYGVSPIFSADVSTSGGLNNEGHQITITNRAIASRQNTLNDEILNFIYTSINVLSYEVVLKPNEEKDEVKDLELEYKKLINAKAYAELGLEVEYKPDEGFIVKEGEVEIQSQQISGFPASGNNALGFSGDEEFEGSPKSVDKAGEEGDKEMEDKLQKELKELLEEIDLKPGMSKKEIEDKVKRVGEKLEKKLKVKGSKFFKAIYEKEAKDISKKLGTKYKISGEDKNIVETLKKDVHYQEAFKNMSRGLSAGLIDIIDKNWGKEGFTIDKVIEKFKEEYDEQEGNLRTIVRTETSKIATASRKAQLDKTGKKYLYEHIGVDDDRTTQMSKEVKRRTKGGVSWDKYVSVIEEVSKKHNPKWVVNKTAPLTHPNSRHVFTFRSNDM